jgi:hypothetical protein
LKFLRHTIRENPDQVHGHSPPMLTPEARERIKRSLKAGPK